MHNPYTKNTSSTTKKTKTTTRYTVSYDFNKSYIEKDLIKQYENQGMDPTEASKKAKEQMNKLPNYQSMNIYSSLDTRKEKQAAESESKRIEKEKAWNERHANDGTKELLWILIPGVVVTLICVYLFRRENKIKRFDGEVLQPYREKARAVTGEILKNEDDTNRMKFKLNQLYKEMKALDPIPEKVSPPTTIKLHKKQRKRWE
jgi:ATP-dependent Zn protease